MRKFFSIVVFVFAGISAGSIIFGAFQEITHDGDGMKTKLIVIAIMATISILFFALASWIYPLKNWHKPIAITLFTTVGLTLFGVLNNYFLMKDMRNLDVGSNAVQEILAAEKIGYDLPLGFLASLVLLVIATLFYRKRSKV